jgi:protoporphyrinogen oxidase
MYAARRTGLKKEMFGYVLGGYSRFLDRFASRLVESGVDVRLNTPLERVAPDGVGLRVTSGDGTSESFDRVVVTLPAPVAAAVCDGLSDDEYARLRGVRYQGIICASILLKKPLASYYVTNITESWVPFTAVIEMTTLVDPRHLGGHSLVYLPKYVVPDDPAFALSDQELKDQFLGALERMYADFRLDDVVAFRISRVRHVAPVSTLNYSQRLPPTTSTVPGLSFVNSAHIVNGTLNVNETVQLAERAVERLIATPLEVGSLA